MSRPRLFGIVNITEDSFSDGGRYLDPRAAIAHARALAAAGADVIDLGAAASNIDSAPVLAEEEIRRLDPVIAALVADGIVVSVDSFQPRTQRFAIACGSAYLNDIAGFDEPAFYPELAEAECRLILMHSVGGPGRAAAADLSADMVWQRVFDFFGERLQRLQAAGIARDRLILDPGMGLFLSSRAEASLRVLAGLERLKRAFGLPVLVSVSRKSFLRAVTGRRAAAEAGPATLAAELYAVAAGADYIRTHDPGALRDALTVTEALREQAAQLPADAFAGSAS
ncbi:MAG: dihydropteroate synthase [Alphaproteobacteria bacterium]|nr:dihydropteroate synthase [Alphaproteobacteria bacterium]